MYLRAQKCERACGERAAGGAAACAGRRPRRVSGTESMEGAGGEAGGGAPVVVHQREHHLGLPVPLRHRQRVRSRHASAPSICLIFYPSTCPHLFPRHPPPALSQPPVLLLCAARSPSSPVLRDPCGAGRQAVAMAALAPWRAQGSIPRAPPCAAPFPCGCRTKKAARDPAASTGCFSRASRARRWSPGGSCCTSGACRPRR